MGGIQRHIRLLLVISFGYGFAIFSLGVRGQYDVLATRWLPLALSARLGLFDCAQETTCLDEDDDESEQHDHVASALVLDRCFVSPNMQQKNQG